MQTQLTTYRCHRAASRAGFKHGDGVLKRRQDWSVGEVVNVGFVRGLMVVRKQSNGTYDLVTAKGVRYDFQPHGGLFRVEA